MENENMDTSFKYTYSAKEQDEIKRIQQKYLARETEEDGMAKLRKLDAGVTRKPTIVSLAMGIVGALIMGTGMSLVMTDFGMAFGLQGMASIVVGIVVGIVGIVPVGLAYPMYNKILKEEREKVAPEILRLTQELLK